MARQSRSAIAAEVFKDPIIKKYVLIKLGVLLRRELMVMCSENAQSVMRNCDLLSFSWNRLLSEMSSNAPVLLAILQSCTHTQRPRQNRNAVVGMCCAVLLKFRFSKMSIVQRIISLILYAGSSGKQVVLLIYSQTVYVQLVVFYYRYTIVCRR